MLIFSKKNFSSRVRSLLDPKLIRNFLLSNSEKKKLFYHHIFWISSGKMKTIFFTFQAHFKIPIYINFKTILTPF